MHVGGKVSDVPIMLVCEEAHNYVPRTGGAQYDSSRKSIERIAKEGRKYGVTLMVVSQRPSEVSERRNRAVRDGDQWQRAGSMRHWPL